ncbi:hypothetical protein C0Q70_20886 [Pomacea canaliculata]|uniref:EF-hand domain-containing protein n=1 Tax=Pomacea canaliculata TaxID=400727 RepID=A0A2T7NAZ1_POMCA|nr:hypothetical protein C0Q70_20886 [Pomacea canaliculata]
MLLGCRVEQKRGQAEMGAIGGVYEKEREGKVRDVFDLFDFWDGRDGLIDAVKVGDLLRCVGLNPTLATVKSVGGTTKPGERLTDEQVDEIMKLTDITIDLEGNIKYADFINKVMTGPPEAK